MGKRCAEWVEQPGKRASYGLSLNDMAFQTRLRYPIQIPPTLVANLETVNVTIAQFEIYLALLNASIRHICTGSFNLQLLLAAAVE